MIVMLLQVESVQIVDALIIAEGREPMIELLLIAITWYITKLFYTRDIGINWTDMGDPDIAKYICYGCSKSGYTAQENLRAPHYCMSCK